MYSMPYYTLYSKPDHSSKLVQKMQELNIYYVYEQGYTYDCYITNITPYDLLMLKLCAIFSIHPDLP